MAFEYGGLGAAWRLPFPPDGAGSYIQEWFALKMRPLTDFPLHRNPHQPPSSSLFRLYKNSLFMVHDPSDVDRKERREKIASFLRTVQKQVEEAKNSFAEMFRGFEAMSREVQDDFQLCRAQTLVGLKRFKEMVSVRRRLSKANHCLLHFKETLEEALETYEEAEMFLRRAAPQSGWESPERLLNRFTKLKAIHEQIQQLEKQEVEACQTKLDEMYQVQEKTVAKQTLLLAAARHLARLLHRADLRLQSLKTEEAKLMKGKDEAWRDYSIINMTIFDLTRGLIELRDLSPRLLEGTLEERFHLIRREHALNKEILRRWGERGRRGEQVEEAGQGPVLAAEKSRRQRAEFGRTLERLKAILAKYQDKPLPDKITKYLVWLKRQNPAFPEPDQLWAYLNQLVRASLGEQEENINET